MGNKINPFLFRLVLNRNWNSIWCVDKKNFSNYLIEDYEIRNFIRKRLKKIICTNIIIKKTKLRCNIVLYIIKKKYLKKFYNRFFINLKKQLILTFKKEIFIKVKNIRNVNTDPVLIFNKIENKIKFKKSYKSLIKFFFKKLLKNSIRGIKILIKGRINGSSMSKKQVFKEGKIPLQKICSDIRYHSGVVKTIYGLIGIKIWIYMGNYMYI